MTERYLPGSRRSQSSLPPAEPGARAAGSLEQLAEPLTAVLNNYAAEQRSRRAWTLIKRVGISAGFLMIGCMWLFTYGNLLGMSPQVITPTVAQVEITGQIGPGSLSSADRLVPMIASLCDQPMVRGIVLHIDSPGGSPGDAERIGASIDSCKVMPVDPHAHSSTSNSPKTRPVIAVIDGLGASAAYMVAIHADEIYANPTGMVGSIGIIMEGFKVNGVMQKLGASSFAYSSGSLKTMLSPFVSDTPQQRAVAQELVNKSMAAFRADVIAHRPHLKLDSKDLWSGRVWVADDAKNMGLIDDIGLLEPVEHQRFKGFAIQSYEPQRNVRDALSMETWVNAIASDITRQLRVQ